MAMPNPFSASRTNPLWGYPRLPLTFGGFLMGEPEVWRLPRSPSETELAGNTPAVR
jgi:hypothetical protein